MATAATGVEPKETECAVCHADFTDPKILPCAHLLCRDCLVTWLKSDGENQCPLCRCAVVDPWDLASKSCEDIADALPTDLAMVSLVESVRILNKNHVCVVCVNVAATGLCLQCSDMLCSSCVAAHKKLSGTRHHKVESLTSLTPESLSASRPFFCSVHSDRPPELFCVTHCVSVCSLCATADHRSCPEVTKLATRIKEACAVLDQLIDTLSKGEQGLEQAISQLDQHLADIDRNTQAALTEIDAAYGRLETSLQAWRHRLKELINEADSDAKAAVHGGKAILLERRGKLTSHRRLAERVKKTTPPSSMDEMSSKLKTRVAGLDYSTTLPEDVKRAMVKKVTLDPQALTRIEMELNSLGELTPVTHVTSATSLTPSTSGTSVTSATFGTHVTSATHMTPITAVTQRGPVTPPTSAKPVTPAKPGILVTPAFVSPAKAQQVNVPPAIATVRQGRQPSGFSFHANRGENVELSDNQQTAERVRGDWRGIVLSIDPMVVNALYEVTLEQIEQKWPGTSFLTGVTNQDPASLVLPTYAGDWDSAIVIQYDSVRTYGLQVQSAVGRRLADLPAGARIGLLVDPVGCLHVYRDGQSQGVAATNITHPVYAFFEVRRRYKKVKALPLTFRN